MGATADVDDHFVAIESGDPAQDSTDCPYLIAYLDRVAELLHLALTAPLGKDQRDVEEATEDDERKKQTEQGACGVGRLVCCKEQPGKDRVVWHKSLQWEPSPHRIGGNGPP